MVWKVWKERLRSRASVCVSLGGQWKEAQRESLLGTILDNGGSGRGGDAHGQATYTERLIPVRVKPFIRSESESENERE